MSNSIMNNSNNHLNDRISQQTEIYFETLRKEQEEKEVEYRYHTDFLEEAEKLNPRQIGYHPRKKAKILNEFKGYKGLITGKTQNGKITYRNIHDCAIIKPNTVGIVFLKEVKKSRKELSKLL